MKKSSTIHFRCEKCDSKCHNFFDTMDEEHLELLETVKTCNIYKKKSILFHEGTRPLGVYCINKGKVKVYKQGYDGKEQIVQISKEGDLLGYRAMLSDELYPVTAETLEETSICFIPKSEFFNLLNKSPALNEKLLRAACHELGVMTDSMTNLAQKSVRERFAVALLMLKDTYGNDVHDNGPVVINLTREDLANIVGTATETLIRLIHDFKEEKLIETEGRKIKILDSTNLIKVGNLH